MSERVLRPLEPRGVFRFFEDLAAIPRGSGNTRAVSDYCAAFARERGLRVRQDEKNNVVIWQEGTPGYEDHPAVILQGHLDMVCAKDPDCPVDMTREGLRLAAEDGFVFARGTTLGGDDGIAVAYALAILDDKTIPHPPIEAVFTVDEEIGLLGAAALDCGDLRGRRLLNIDSESEGILTVGCAGGGSCDFVLPLSAGHGCGVLGRVSLSGFTGGHSGTEIHKGRGNAIALLGRLLERLSAVCPIRLQSLQGGKQDNGIPAAAEAVFLLSGEDREKAAPLSSAMVRSCPISAASDSLTLERTELVRWRPSASSRAIPRFREVSTRPGMWGDMAWTPFGRRQIRADTRAVSSGERAWPQTSPPSS